MRGLNKFAQWASLGRIPSRRSPARGLDHTSPRGFARPGQKPPFGEKLTDLKSWPWLALADFNSEAKEIKIFGRNGAAETLRISPVLISEGVTGVHNFPFFEISRTSGTQAQTRYLCLGPSHRCPFLGRQNIGRI